MNVVKAGPTNSEVRWQLDGITMFGTLTQPDGPGPFPAVVLVAGSGPTDRDRCSPLLAGSNGSARLLAEALRTIVGRLRGVLGHGGTESLR
jgi:hypothetical protein